MKDLSIGFRGFARALGFALRHGMWWMFLAPVVLWLLFAGGIVWVSSSAVEWVGGWVSTFWEVELPTTERTGLEGAWDDLLGLLDTSKDVLVLFAVKAALWFFFGIIGKYLVLILLSPLLAYASERTEEILTGRAFPFQPGQFIKDVGRGILMAIRNGVYELSINVLVWACTLFVAVVAPATVVVLWLVSSWFYGFSMFDYIFERHRMNIRTSARTARERRGIVLANGMLFNFLMNPPVLHWFFGPVLSAICFCTVPVIASIGAVIAWHEAGNDNSQVTPVH